LLKPVSYKNSISWPISRWPLQRTAVICEPLHCYRAEQPELLHNFPCGSNAEAEPLINLLFPKFDLIFTRLRYDLAFHVHYQRVQVVLASATRWLFGLMRGSGLTLSLFAIKTKNLTEFNLKSATAELIFRAFFRSEGCHARYELAKAVRGRDARNES
jgi:hypothetical protein